MKGSIEDLEVELLLEAIRRRYGHDFRHYSRPSLSRRLEQAMTRMGCSDLSSLQGRVLRDASLFSTLLQTITVGTSEMFRDPDYFLALREQVLPVLRTYPSRKVWVAGCSTGEEVYSLCILLEESGLLDRTIVYATDINPASLLKASRGIFPIADMAKNTQNYQRAGGKRSFSSYYTVDYDSALFDRRLARNVVFSDHDLATDAMFAEVQLVSCRNVLIYFDRPLQDRAISLFCDCLSPRGFLGLGSYETLRASPHDAAFEPVAPTERLFRKRTAVA